MRRVEGRRTASGDGLARELATTLRAGLDEVGWSQDKLAGRAGTSQATVSRILRGDPASMRLDVIAGLAGALGLRLRLATDHPFRVGSRRQGDLVHARASSYIGRRLVERGWAVRHEVEIGRRAVHGWIDTLGFRAEDGALFVAEFKSEQHDAGAVQRTLSWYEREAWDAARVIGWRPRVLGSALLLLATRHNDDGVRLNHELLVQTCPTRSTELSTWLDSPSSHPLPRAVAMIDPLSRRRQWLWSTRQDGRRTAAAYVDYAECARAIVRGRRSA